MAAGGCLAVLTLAAACGSSATKTTTATTTAKRAAVHSAAPTGPCRPSVLDVAARFLHVAPASVTTAVGTGNDGNPQCTYATRVAGGKRVSLNADVYSGPQPYFVLERTIEEAAQPFTPTRLSPAPQAVNGLGLVASWFPNRNQLMSTDGLKIITVTVAWPGAGTGREIAVATAISRPYLKVLTPKQAAAVANGYPCGCE
ncbi:MAG TPA: hypothetical protein VEF89_32815 [Solirubrobacteraceae bacterium]|nr:hypothetical protein [Solirubrobacteraceae bacterium]